MRTYFYILYVIQDAWFGYNLAWRHHRFSFLCSVFNINVYSYIFKKKNTYTFNLKQARNNRTRNFLHDKIHTFSLYVIWMYSTHDTQNAKTHFRYLICWHGLFLKHTHYIILCKIYVPIYHINYVKI